MTRVTAVRVLIWLAYVSVAFTLVAYDCTKEGSNYTAISIRDIQPCAEADSEFETAEIGIRVIQRNDIRLVKVETCLVEITRLISYCGMHSHSSIVEGGLSNFVHQLGSSECTDLHRYKSVKMYGQVIGNVNMNGTTTASLTLLGSVDVTGSCDGATYHEAGRTWKNVVITAAVKIVTRDYLARVKLEENEISLIGGVTCPFLKGYCFDTTLGETVWQDDPTSSCDKYLSLVYRGRASKVEQKSSKELYVVIDKGDRIFALSLVKKTWICNQEVWQTEHPRLLVIDENEGQRVFIQPQLELLPENTDLVSYVNSKFLYVEQSYKREINKLYTDTIYRRCLVHREVLRNRLLLAPTTPSAISQILQDERGYVGRVLGEVLYIMKCVPTVVRIRRTERCFHELPISVNNQSKFMAPVTRIIQSHAEEIECNGVTPPLYYVDNEWIGLTPHPTIKKAPKELRVESPAKLEFNPIQPVGQYGLYTQEEVSKVQRILTFGTERKAVENYITRRVAGLEAGNQGFATLNIFDPAEMKELAQSTFRQLWGWFSDVGVFMSGLIGFYMIFRVLKYGISVVINGLHLYQTIGCGIALMASLWNTLTFWVVQRQQKRSTESQDDKEEAVTTVEVSQPQGTATTLKVYPVLPVKDNQHWTETRESK